MDDKDETNDVVERLCALIGIIMEDASVTALLSSESEDMEARLAALERAGRDIVVLAEAAKVITRRWPTSDGSAVGGAA